MKTKTNPVIPGWYDWHEWAKETVAALPPGGLYVEVGCFLGKSTCAIAELMQARNVADESLKLRLHAVDLFEVPATADPELLRVVTEATGGLRVFRPQFEANLKAAGVRSLVKQAALPSVKAAAIYKDASVDVVFIDADHSYDAVRADIAAWWPKLKPGGVMAGHDIRTYESVYRAVHDQFNSMGFPVRVIPEQNIWEVRK